MQACLQMTERERIIQIRKPSSAAKSKVPFYRSLNLEIERPFRNGTSYNLMNKLAEEYAGKVMRPLNVKDANFPKGRVNEYIFSPTAPNP